MKYKKIYIDMDGVLADFEAAFSKQFGDPTEYEKKHGTEAFWEAVYEDPTFYRDLPPFPHLWDLIDLCKEHSEAHPVILSSPSRTNRPLCMIQKREWIDEHVGERFPAIFESKKHIYAGEGKLLIDDYEKKITAWREAGGNGHLFTDFESFVSWLKLGEKK